MDVKRTERGWGGHFCLAHRCCFRRNTLLSYNGIEIVVSTVGMLMDPVYKQFETLGHERYYETMAFHAQGKDARYHDADFGKEIRFESPWAIGETHVDDKANDMHEAVCDELSERLVKGDFYER